MYVRAFDELGRVGDAGGCTDVLGDRATFSTIVAQHYVSTELKQQRASTRVDCRDGKVCEVAFPGDITVLVSLVKLPTYVIARQTGQGKPRREYAYRCSSDGTVRLLRRWYRVRIVLIDPTGVLNSKDKLRTDFSSKLAQKFSGLDRRWLNHESLAFEVDYWPRTPTGREQAGFGRLDCPVYLLDRQHGVKTVRDLMTKHGIPKTITVPPSTKAADPYKLAETAWKAKDAWGVGIPSGDGHRKVGFIKTHRIFDAATGDFWQAFVNATAHEIGHMGNRRHSKQGLMRYPVPLDRDIDFGPGDKGRFLADLVRLRLLRV